MRRRSGRMRRRGVNHCPGSRIIECFTCVEILSVSFQARQTVSRFTPCHILHQYALSYDWWGDMPQWMHDFLDGLSDDETEGILYDEHSPGLLRWRYDIPAKKQYCEERWHDDEEWVPTKVREIRRSLVPDPKPA